MDLTARSETPNADDHGAYCRELESYLTQRNGGHLVRIVGPAFELVCGWADQGVPIKVACRGIDRYLERLHAKREARRRPVRIEFCEADVLDVFDEWRRAVGVSDFRARADAAGADEGTRSIPLRADGRESLPAHLERAVARLTALRAGAERWLSESIDTVVRELDGARATAKGLRGAAREELLARLRELDASLLGLLRAHSDAATLEMLAAEADAELAPFRARMPREAYEQSRAACVDRLLRERARLPTLTLE